MSFLPFHFDTAGGRRPGAAEGLRGVRDADRGALGRGDPRGACSAEKARQIDYTFTDDIGYSGDMERVLRQVAEEE